MLLCCADAVCGTNRCAGADAQPIRRVARVERAGSSDFRFLVDDASSTSGWVTETGTRSETDASQLIEVTPTFGEVYAKPHASEWALDDPFFDVEAWLVNSAAAALAAAEAITVVSGTGSSQPSGLLKVTPSTSADDASPERAAGSLQYLQAGSPPALTDDALVDVLEQFGDGYPAARTASPADQEPRPRRSCRCSGS
jgi:HK97 family phage major capsid protein